MGKPEGLFQKSELSHAGTISYGGRPIEFNWYTHETIGKAYENQIPKVVHETADYLPVQLVPQAAGLMLSQSGIMEQTKHRLFPGDPAIIGFDAMHVQMGQKAYILFGQMRTEAGSRPFAIHIGNNPIDSRYGDEAARDFHDLTYLSDRADRMLPDSLKKKYRFLKPMDLGEPVSIGNGRYSWFTMPFIEDYGELKADIEGSGADGVRFLYFRHSLTHDTATTDASKRAQNNARNLHEKILAAARKYGYENAVPRMKQLPEAKAIFDQIEDLAFGEALIYLLSDGHMPAEHLVNAGDWMVKFVSDRLYLYLITVRGGFKKLGSDQEFINEMMSHTEPTQDGGMINFGIPLFFDQEERVRSALSKARKLLKLPPAA